MKKRFLALLLTGCLCMSMASVTVFADEIDTAGEDVMVVEDEVTVQTYASDGLDMSGTEGAWSWSISNGTLTISGTGSVDYSVGWDRSGWRDYYNDYITKVVVKEGITALVDGGCFAKLTNLTTVSLPSSLTSIGDDSFNGCTKLTSINIPSKVTYIGGSAFEGCTSLPSITIGSAVTSIGIYAFKNCSSLSSVTMGSRVTSIGNYAFQNCSSLSSIKIGSNVKSIGYYAFADCSSLSSVTFGNKLTSIGDSAFEGCKAMTSITFPNSLRTIGDYALEDCTGLGKVTFGTGLSELGGNVFLNCTGLTSVTFNGKLTEATIYSSVFNGCTGLTDIYYAGSKSDWNNVSIYGYNEYLASATIHCATPDTPTISKATNTASGIKVTWKKVSGASGYYIYRKTGSSGSYKKIATIKSGSTVSYTNKTSGTYKVSAGKTYYYKVVAYKGSNKSSRSSAVKTVRLAKPGITSLKNSSSKKMTVKWSKKTGATGYQVQYATNKGFTKNKKTVTVKGKSTTKKTISKLKKGKTYYVRIRSYKSVDGKKYYSAWSTVKRVKIKK